MSDAQRVDGRLREPSLALSEAQKQGERDAEVPLAPELPVEAEGAAGDPLGAEAGVSLAPEWIEWLTDNLLRGAHPSQIVSELSSRGVPQTLAESTVALVRASPVYRAAQKQASHAQRLALLQRLLAAQRELATERNSVERSQVVHANTFFDRFVATNSPVIFVDLVTKWPAFGRWSPEYFAERFGEVELLVAQNREADPAYDMHTKQLSKQMRVLDFVRLLQSVESSNDFYMVAQHHNLDRPELAPLFDEMHFPDGWLDTTRFQRSCALWFGPKGTVTPLHHDTSNILFCQVYGQKKFTLVNPLELELCDGATSMYAGFDPESPAGRARLEGKLVQECVLEPGEALFIPAGYWHHVRALTVSISVAVNNLSRPNSFDWFRPGEIRVPN